LKLLIAIPALNEEDSIAAIIEKSLDAREYICRHSPITEVSIVVVSDGSTDATAEIAGRYANRIGLIVFPKNRGYGAAIKEAWRGSDAEVLGFLDADGTCDPRFFAPLCDRLVTEKADVVLGCRVNPESQMPRLRKLGNVFFAALLAAFSSKRVRDTASGMRVVSRAALHKLLPLPDGLHFTPAMSARALLSDAVKIVEIDMPYHEREGQSKLRVVKDGLRFLRVILETAFLYRPSRPLNAAAAALFAVACALMASPTWYYLQHRSVLQWMIYRFLVSDVCAIGACLLFCAGYLTGRMVSIALPQEISDRSHKLVHRFFRSPLFWFAPVLFAACGCLLVLSSVLERLRTGGTEEHWSRYVVMTFWLSTALILAVTRIIDDFLGMVAARLYYLDYLFDADAGRTTPVGDGARTRP
jgi:glycosyltransferase involved in cell wall biosynthesis